MCYRYDERRGGFRVGNDVVSFCPLDVCLFFGLPIVGKKVNLKGKEQSKSRRLLGYDNVTVRDVYNELLKKQNDDEVEDFCRLYILLALAEFLFPNTKRNVKSGLFKLVDDLELVGSYNWGCAIYEFLVDSICFFCNNVEKKETSLQRYVVGCAYILQVNIV
ncbi:hypothetical protein Fmac_004334 [Flemingia macrophylla]|uniref:Aminotransferase-like plant mobile domain-containing protein n=1 Tax=Flemingia macrophylla TaxID=520843 RepID=A0ABD1N4S5_9FABA